MKNTINIVGYTYTVGPMSKRDGSTKRGNVGQVTYKDMAIEIDTSLPNEIVETTMMHEAIHVIDEHLNIGLNEHKIRLIETGVIQFLRNAGVNLKPLRDLAKGNSTK